MLLADECLSRGTKRKLTQRTLLELNFCPVSKIQTCSYDSEQLEKDLFPAAHDESPVQDVSWRLSNLTAVEECQNQVDNLSRNPINKDEISDVPDFDVTITQDDIYGVTLETFIVGHRFGDETELYLGARIHLSRDPDNVKDPNAIKVCSLSYAFFPFDLNSTFTQNLKAYMHLSSVRLFIQIQDALKCLVFSLAS